MNNIKYFESIKDDYNLIINKYIPNFDKVRIELFNSQVGFNTWAPDEFKDAFVPEETMTDEVLYRIHSPKVLTIEFGIKCNFNYVHKIASILKNYGIEYIYPNKFNNNKIIVGSHFSYQGLENNIDKVPISLSKFLVINSDLKMEYVLNNVYKTYNNKQTTYSHKDAFNALTDGQYGDFGDFQNSGLSFDDLFD